MSPRVFVGNPGSTPEMVQMANALAAATLLRAYAAPFAPTSGELDQSNLLRLGPVGRALLSQLRRRAVDEAVGRAQRYPTARLREVTLTAAIRLGMSTRALGRLVSWRNSAFEAAVAGALEPEDTDLIVPAGSAYEPLIQAKRSGVRGWLDCPIAHHDFASRIQLEEAQRTPEYAESLQISTVAQKQRLDREIVAADRVIVLSNFQRRTFVEAGVSPSQLDVLPLGVDIDLFHPRPRRRSGPFTIGFVGQVTQRKGISYLAAAFDAMRPAGARLLMVGRPIGTTRPWMRDGVEHHAAVARATLPTFYDQMDVFVLPSLVEGFPLTALEAMASGIPTIVSENTFGSDVVHDGRNGYVVPIRDVDAIVDRLETLAADDDLRARMGAEARVTAEQFSWDAFGRRLVELVTSTSAPNAGSS